MSITIFDSEEVCANCKRYNQHYVYDEIFGYIACNCGHCPYPRLKHRTPGQTCEHFERRETV